MNLTEKEIDEIIYIMQPPVISTVISFHYTRLAMGFILAKNFKTEKNIEMNYN